jgi:hypothetical protein
MSEQEFSYSHDGEQYHGEFDSREAALAEAVECASSRVTKVYTGVNVPLDISEFSGGHGDTLIEDIGEQIYELVGEVNDGLDASREAAKELDERIAAVIEAWAAEFGVMPICWTVTDVVEHATPEVTK